MPEKHFKGYRKPHPLAHKFQIQRAIPHIGAATPRGWADNMWQILSILNQLSLGSCVWHGVTQMIRGLRVRSTYPDGNVPSGLHYPLGSRMMGYYWTLVLAKEGIDDYGCDPVTAMAALNQWGLCDEDLYWPYDVSTFPNLRRGLLPEGIDEAMNHGYDQRGPYEFNWITTSGTRKVDQTKIAQDEGYLVGIATVVGPEYENWKPGDPPLKPPTNFNYNDPDYGGHFTILGGYNGDTHKDVGSWGSNMFDNGVALFDSSYIEWDETSSLLVMRKAPIIP